MNPLEHWDELGSRVRYQHVLRNKNSLANALVTGLNNMQNRLMQRYVNSMKRCEETPTRAKACNNRY